MSVAAKSPSQYAGRDEAEREVRGRGVAFKGLSWAEKPYTVYYHKATVRQGAAVLLASGDTPLVVEGRVGKGRIIVLLTSVFGEKNPKVGGVPFWEWGDWSALMAQLIARHEAGTKGIAGKPAVGGGGGATAN